MGQFKVIGYYICEIQTTPSGLKGVGNKMLSVSRCIGEQHPRWECVTGSAGEGEHREYQNILKLNNEQYRDCIESAERLFHRRQLDVDSRFLKLPDAKEFHKRFCTAIPCRVVSLSTTPRYFDLLAEELKSGNGFGLMSGETDNSLWIGNDILGWDLCIFHSFLCNGLQKELHQAKFNEFSLLENHFEEVLCYARQLEGQGEPVLWIPCRMGEIVS